MDDSKRKDPPSGAGRDDRGGKRSRGSHGGKWQTPHQISKGDNRTKIEPGDQGIWATCVKGKEGKCTEELKVLFDDYAEKLYGIKANGATEDEEAEEDDDNIEASIQKEIAALNAKESTGKKEKLFTAVYLDIPCVLFFKTRKPIEPVEFVKRICEDAAAGGPRRSRFVNRLTPMVMMGKATESGLEEVGKSVLGEVFGGAEQNEEEKEDETEGRLTYAIRPSIRASNSLKRDAVIKQVAKLVPARHKVDLSNPDKVIVIEIYKSVCGMSIVGGDWEKLKRFNLAEIYQPKNPETSKSEKTATNAAAAAEDASTEKAPTQADSAQASTQAVTEATADVDRTDVAIPKDSTA